MDGGAQAMPTCELQPDANPISHSEPAREAQPYGPPPLGRHFRAKSPALSPFLTALRDRFGPGGTAFPSSQLLMKACPCSTAGVGRAAEG